MKYIHSLLAIWHHQLNVKRKFNVNFNLNMKYDNVRVKQKYLILISQHHWSPTTSHPPLLNPLPPAHPHLYAFHPRCFWKFRKNWKEEGNNMHRKHMFFEICNENCFSTEALYLTVNKKLRHSYNQFGLGVVSKKLEHNITYKILMNKIFPNWLQNLSPKSPF